MLSDLIVYSLYLIAMALAMHGVFITHFLELELISGIMVVKQSKEKITLWGGSSQEASPRASGERPPGWPGGPWSGQWRG
jgi:hypothetical protein